MNITELVQFFRNDGTFEDFCKSYSLDPKSEIVEIFAEAPFTEESPLVFIEIEKTEGKNRHYHDGIEYYTLFDFYYFQDAIKESKEIQNQHFTDIEIAKKLLSIAINDA